MEEGDCQCGRYDTQARTVVFVRSAHAHTYTRTYEVRMHDEKLCKQQSSEKNTGVSI